MTYLISVNTLTAPYFYPGMIHTYRESVNSHTKHYSFAHATTTLPSLGFSMTSTRLARVALSIVRMWQSSSCSQTLERAPLPWTVTLVTGTYLLLPLNLNVLDSSSYITQEKLNGVEQRRRASPGGRG
jgi:hypothetical protein